MNAISGEIWFKIICPNDECKVTNFVYGGYFPDSDSSRIDADGFTCWGCKKEFKFYEDEFIDSEEAMYFREGKPVSTFWTVN